MIISLRQGTDKRQTYTWTDAAGDILQVSNARLVAVDANDVPVLDLAYSPTPLSESAIQALPNINRGYLAPKAEASLELHISEKLTIAPGDYSFDLKVQETASGDWDTLSDGIIRVTKSVTPTP